MVGVANIGTGGTICAPGWLMGTAGNVGDMTGGLVDCCVGIVDCFEVAKNVSNSC